MKLEEALDLCYRGKKNVAKAAEEVEIPFIEMLIRRDFITSVLDAQGKREQQMAAIGACVSSMTMPAHEYTAVLGSDIDATAAVAATASTE